MPADEAHREMRERAQRAFAALAPADGPVAPRASRLVVPVEETWRGRSLGYFVAMLGDYPRAVRVFTRTLDLDPDDTEARYALGLAQWRAGQPDAAVREWREVLRREPGNQAAQSALSQVRR